MLALKNCLCYNDRRQSVKGCVGFISECFGRLLGYGASYYAMEKRQEVLSNISLLFPPDKEHYNTVYRICLWIDRIKSTVYFGYFILSTVYNLCYNACVIGEVVLFLWLRENHKKHP